MRRSAVESTTAAAQPRVEVAEPGPAAPEPGQRAPEPGPATTPEVAAARRRGALLPPPIRRRIDDRALMLVLIPSFGVAISHATDLFGPLTPGDGAWWWGHAWFIAGAALIYLTNRAILFAGRAHADWFSRPVARLVLLMVGIGLGTVPTTWIMLQGWAALSGVPLGGALEVVMLINIICVLFVTWLYETLFLIRERVDDQVRVERALTARTEAELATLRAQVDPHFLFNALNTLSGLIESRPAQARAFVEHLARVYRSSLDVRGRTGVPLAEELELGAAYAALLHIRFGDAVRVRLDAPARTDRLVVPGALQLLLENVVRHNAVDPALPLPVTVTVAADTLVVEHPRRPRPARPGAGLGLANLDARCRALTGRGIEVDTGDPFCVRVPLVAR